MHERFPGLHAHAAHAQRTTHQAASRVSNVDTVAQTGLRGIPPALVAAVDARSWQLPQTWALPVVSISPAVKTVTTMPRRTPFQHPTLTFLCIVYSASNSAVSALACSNRAAMRLGVTRARWLSNCAASVGEATRGTLLHRRHARATHLLQCRHHRAPTQPLCSLRSSPNPPLQLRQPRFQARQHAAGVSRSAGATSTAAHAAIQLERDGRRCSGAGTSTGTIAAAVGAGAR